MRRGVLLLLVACLPAFAQISSGSFYGQVRDQSGGSVADSQITIEEENTGFEWTTHTDVSGSYRVPELMPGVYTATAERTGFRRIVAAHLALEVNRASPDRFQPAARICA